MERRPERKRSNAKLAYLVFKIIIFIQLLVICILFALLVKPSPSFSTSELRVEDAMDVAWTKNGPVYTYVVSDPDYGHEYVVTSLGGITERDTN